MTKRKISRRSDRDPTSDDTKSSGTEQSRMAFLFSEQEALTKSLIQTAQGLSYKCLPLSVHAFAPLLAECSLRIRC